MNEHEKARSSAGTPERAMEPGAASRQATNSRDNLTMNMAQGQGVISSLLGRGQSAAVPLAHLVSITGWDGRTVRLMIERERRSDIQILSDCKSGYYLAADEVEAARFVASMRHRAREIETTASAIEQAVGLD